MELLLYILHWLVYHLYYRLRFFPSSKLLQLPWFHQLIEDHKDDPIDSSGKVEEAELGHYDVGYGIGDGTTTWSKHSPIAFVSSTIAPYINACFLEMKHCGCKCAFIDKDAPSFLFFCVLGNIYYYQIAATTFIFDGQDC